MSIREDFSTFLSDIEPSKTTVDEISSAQNALRDYLATHKSYTSCYKETYLSGSYAKHTAIRPVKDDDNRDVDIVVETSHTINDDAAEVLKELRDALAECDKYSSASVQTHSVGVQLSKLDIDVVPLATSGSRWYIGNRVNDSWKETNPRGHKGWSTEFNQAHDNRFKPVVKIFKWWRREHCPKDSRWPKGITLEKIIADNFPADTAPYDDLVSSVFRSIIDSYSENLDDGDIPCIEDPSLPGNDLAEGYSIDDFNAFCDEIRRAIDLIDQNGSCNDTWRSILGNRFPAGDSKTVSSLSTQRYLPIEQALVVKWRKPCPWPIKARGFGIQISAEVIDGNGKTFSISNNGEAISKGCKITYHALRSSRLPTHTMMWQIVNTGKEALQDNCPRGEIAEANLKNGSRVETTAYVGRHYVQCFAIRNGECIARSKEFFINVAE